jgi:hypothetical protein
MAEQNPIMDYIICTKIALQEQTMVCIVGFGPQEYVQQGIAG